MVIPVPNEKAAATACTILLVDDEDALLEIGRQMLEHLGHTVIEAQSGKQAISEFTQHKDRIDLIILDILMPGMNGTKTYKRLKAINPQVRVLIASGFAIDDTVRGLLEDGANGFLPKPFTLQELSMKVQKALEPISTYRISSSSMRFVTNEQDGNTER
jgi:CheY-like chemotaxis protein